MKKTPSPKKLLAVKKKKKDPVRGKERGKEFYPR